MVRKRVTRWFDEIIESNWCDRQELYVQKRSSHACEEYGLFHLHGAEVTDMGCRDLCARGGWRCALLCFRRVALVHFLLAFLLHLVGAHHSNGSREQGKLASHNGRTAELSCLSTGARHPSPTSLSNHAVELTLHSPPPQLAANVSVSASFGSNALGVK